MRRRFNKKIILLVVGVVLVIVFLNLYQSEIRNFFYLISQPIQKKLWSVKIQNENAQLRLQLQELRAKIAQLSEGEKENQVLREALQVGLKEEFKLIFVQVIGKNIDDDTLIINKGAKDGVKKNLPVISQQKALVGRITEVFENFSKVELISNKKLSFEGEIIQKKVRGLVKGKGNFKLFFDLVPQHEDVKKDELIATTALGGIFPHGLLVGSIKSVKKSDVEPFQQIAVEPAFDLKQLDYVFVITNF
jgi:rod shape-determining protein MreC